MPTRRGVDCRAQGDQLAAQGRTDSTGERRTAAYRSLPGKSRLLRASLGQVSSAELYSGLPKTSDIKLGALDIYIARSARTDRARDHANEL